MGKLKEMLFGKMEAAGLDESQEKTVMDILERRVCLNNIEEDIEGDIDRAIQEVLCCVNKDKIIAELHTLIHDNNKAMARQSVLELQNMRLKKALLGVVNFEWNAWTEAKNVLASLEEPKDGD